MAKDKSENTPKTTQQKLPIVFGITLLVLFVLVLGTKLAISPNMPSYNNYVLMLMPKSIDTVFDDKDLTLYVEKNKDFDKTKNEPLEAYKVYYYKDNDTSTKKIYLKNGKTLKGEKEESNMMVLQFLGNATITDSIIRNILNKALIILFVLLACYLIYIWYLDWCRRQDKKKELNR
ncbi:MAG: hypothetical protein IJR70_02655 [Eubacterium sp.]|nr:hypothetical protein [Eubacterium sp.]